MKTVGQVLKDARLKKRISLDEIARVTRIKKRYLLALEKSEYEKLPGVAYIKGFIKNYGEYIGLAPDQLWALFRREYKAGRDVLLLPRTKDLSRPFWVITPNRVVALMVVFVTTIFFIYLIRGVIKGPYLKVYSPEDNLVVKNLSIKVSGRTEPEAKLTINDQPVQFKSRGEFEVIIQLSLGVNEITFVSTNRLGRRTEVTRTIKVVP
jgi:cytoskeletal protein RodZ